jgi:hypothetical protein
MYGMWGEFLDKPLGPNSQFLTKIVFGFVFYLLEITVAFLHYAPTSKIFHSLHGAYTFAISVA